MVEESIRLDIALLAPRTFACPVEKCRHNYIGYCRLWQCTNYTLFRDFTGRCETCGSSLSQHLYCDACGIMAGPGHVAPSLSLFRTRVTHDRRGRPRTVPNALCGYCVKAWKRLDKLLGRETTFQEFILPQPKMFNGVEGFEPVRQGWSGYAPDKYRKKAGRPKKKRRHHDSTAAH
jgi:hypothetical protein